MRKGRGVYIINTLPTESCINLRHSSYAIYSIISHHSVIDMFVEGQLVLVLSFSLP